MRKKLIKSPIMHFALLGLALFVGSRWLLPAGLTGPTPDTRIVVPQSRVAALASRYEATSGMAVTEDVRAALLQRFADEEMLCREARRWGLMENNRAIDLRLRQMMAFVSDEEHSDEELERQARALGLDSHDAVIRSMLAHNMRLLLSRQGEQQPTDEELESYYERERSRFARPVRLTGWHVFFSRDARGSSAMTAARVAKTKLDTETPGPEDAVVFGDTSPHGNRFEGQLARQLASRFGDEFAKVAETASEERWSDPVETPFGVHLVLVQERTQKKAPPLAEIRARVTAAYQASQRQERLATAMAELRAQYEVVLE